MPFIQFASRVSSICLVPNDRPGRSATARKGITACRTSPNPARETPPPKNLVMSTRPYAAVPSAPLAAMAFRMLSTGSAMCRSTKVGAQQHSGEQGGRMWRMPRDGSAYGAANTMQAGLGTLTFTALGESRRSRPTL